MGTFNPSSVTDFERELQREFFPVIQNITIASSYYGGCDTLEIRFYFGRDSAVSSRYMALHNLLERIAERPAWEQFQVKNFHMDLRKRPRKLLKPSRNSHGLVEFRSMQELDAPRMKELVINGHVTCGVLVVEAWQGSIGKRSDFENTLIL